MPHKLNDDRRHKFAKARYRVTNWPDYDAALVWRGDLTVWLTEKAVAAWYAPLSSKRGGQPIYSDLAIETALALRLVLHLPLRQTEGALRSIINLLEPSIKVPDHTTFSRRSAGLAILPQRIGRDEPVHLLIDSTGLKIYGEGEWLDQKHGIRARRRWRKLHIAVEAESQEIVASDFTGDDVGDVTVLPDLLDQVEGRVDAVIADGAYDGQPAYDAVAARHPEADVIIPPRSTAVPTEAAASQRDRHIKEIEEHGRRGWQRRTGYGRRSLIETAMFRYKTIIGRSLHARTLPNQQTEAKIGCKVLNRMTSLGMPVSVRIK
jgi:transposase